MKDVSSIIQGIDLPRGLEFALFMPDPEMETKEGVLVYDKATSQIGIIQEILSEENVVVLRELVTNRVLHQDSEEIVPSQLVIVVKPETVTRNYTVLMTQVDNRVISFSPVAIKEEDGETMFTDKHGVDHNKNNCFKIIGSNKPDVFDFKHNILNKFLKCGELTISIDDDVIYQHCKLVSHLLADVYHHPKLGEKMYNLIHEMLIERIEDEATITSNNKVIQIKFINIKDLKK